MKFLMTLAASLLLLFSAAQAKTGTSTPADKQFKANNSGVTILHEARHVETRRKLRRKKKSRRKKARRLSKSRLATIRRNAIANSLSGLQRLRPYTTNYTRLRSAVRSYWRRNYRRPSTKGLSRTILRYVKSNFRSRARPKIVASAARGVAKVKAALRKK